jgi:membrane associated rhomboid family serine protease
MRFYRRASPINGSNQRKRLSIVGVLISINIAVSFLGLILWLLIPGSEAYFALKPINILQGKHLWTLILHMFSHGGFFHLFINMFVLFSLGSLCEKIIGRKRFLWFYLISGFFAGVLSVVMAGFFGYGFWADVFGNADVYMVGASGAIFAIAGLYVLLLPRLRFSIIFLPFISFPAYVMVPLVLVLTWLASIWGGLPIGNVAHFGGFLCGIAYGFYLRLKYKRKIMMLQRMFR